VILAKIQRMCARPLRRRNPRPHASADEAFRWFSKPVPGDERYIMHSEVLGVHGGHGGGQSGAVPVEVAADLQPSE
jgi:hypothetical protein